MTPLLFTLGEALAVFLAADEPGEHASANGRSATRPSLLASATRFDRIVSGSEVNVAAGFARCGGRARLVTRVGADALGDAVADQLTQWGVDARVTRDAERPTGTLVRTVGRADRGQAVNLRRGAAIEGLTGAEIDAAWSPDVDAVFVSGITAVRSSSAASAVERTVELARAAGALVVVDPNLRPALGTPRAFAAGLSRLRGAIDIAIGDAAELALLAGSSEADAPAALIASGARLVVTKGGAEGAIVTDGTRTASAQALVPAREVVDTVGAGDAFAAALIHGWLETRDPEISLERASAAAAGVVRVRGDVPPFDPLSPGREVVST